MAISSSRWMMTGEAPESRHDRYHNMSLGKDTGAPGDRQDVFCLKYCHDRLLTSDC